MCSSVTNFAQHGVYVPLQIISCCCIEFRINQCCEDFGFDVSGVCDHAGVCMTIDSEPAVRGMASPP